MFHRLSLVPCILLAACASLVAAVQDSVKTLAATGREGAGNEAAAAAWKKVVAEGPGALLPILAATGGGPVADNWLRLAADAITDAATRAHQTIPLAEIESVLQDTSRPPAARQLAFDLIAQADPALADKIEPGLIHDPVQELRRGAVQRLLDLGKKQTQTGNGDAGKETFLTALDAVRDEDQTNEIVDALKKLGVPVDLPMHFGFLMKWNVIAPFDNTNREGFAKIFPPENEIRLDAAYARDGSALAKLDAAYDGKGVARWRPFESKDEHGKLDFNKPFGSLKEVTGYAETTFDSPVERDAELRLGCKNGWKVWLNGELLFGRDEYHRGAQMDQYKMKCRLKKGANTILVKCCQNEQTEQWTVEWEFQLRVCDSTGTAIVASK